MPGQWLCPRSHGRIKAQDPERYGDFLSDTVTISETPVQRQHSVKWSSALSKWSKLRQAPTARSRPLIGRSLPGPIAQLTGRWLVRSRNRMRRQNFCGGFAQGCRCHNDRQARPRPLSLVFFSFLAYCSASFSQPRCAALLTCTTCHFPF